MKYYYCSNWDGMRTESDSLQGLIDRIKQTEMGSVAIWDKDGLVISVKGERYYQ